MERIATWFGGLTIGMKALAVAASVVLFAVLSPLVAAVATLFFIVCTISRANIWSPDSGKA